MKTSNHSEKAMRIIKGIEKVLCEDWLKISESLEVGNIYIDNRLWTE